ncbi:MAG: hypothetical protein RIT07_324, partial [Bacteroidota bacterium]
IVWLRPVLFYNFALLLNFPDHVIAQQSEPGGAEGTYVG